MRTAFFTTAMVTAIGLAAANANAGAGCTGCDNCPGDLTICFSAGTAISECENLGCSGTESSDQCGTGDVAFCPLTEVGQCDDGLNNDAYQNILTDCDDPACASDPACVVVPTLSEWGLMAMTLLVLTVGTIVFDRRRRPA